MSISFSLAWYVIPAVITVLAIGWAFFWPADRDGMFGSLTTMFMLIPALVVSVISWVIAGVLK